MRELTVYRIETEQNEGPYRKGGYKTIHDHELDTWRHPTPRKDWVGESYEEPLCSMHYGFHCVWLLLRWFNRADRLRLAAQGYRLSIYSVPQEHVIRGRRQCAFMLSHARLLRTVTLH